jgi:hypothetical protein
MMNELYLPSQRIGYDETHTRKRTLDTAVLLFASCTLLNTTFLDILQIHVPAHHINHIWKVTMLEAVDTC